METALYQIKCYSYLQSKRAKALQDYIDSCKINDQNPNDLVRERYNDMEAEISIRGIWSAQGQCWLSELSEQDFLWWAAKQRPVEWRQKRGVTR